MTHNITLWPIPGKGVDGMDLWMDTDEIQVTFPWVWTENALDRQPSTVVQEFVQGFITQRSEASDRKTYTLGLPIGEVTGWVRSISFSQEGGMGDMIKCQMSFVVRHIADT